LPRRQCGVRCVDGIDVQNPLSTTTSSALGASVGMEVDRSARTWVGDGAIHVHRWGGEVGDMQPIAACGLWLVKTRGMCYGMLFTWLVSG
jgi:hypothetical protein